MHIPTTLITAAVAASSVVLPSSTNGTNSTTTTPTKTSTVKTTVTLEPGMADLIKELQLHNTTASLFNPNVLKFWCVFAGNMDADLRAFCDRLMPGTRLEADADGASIEVVEGDSDGTKSSKPKTSDTIAMTDKLQWMSEGQKDDYWRHTRPHEVGEGKTRVDEGGRGRHLGVWAGTALVMSQVVGRKVSDQ